MPDAVKKFFDYCCQDWAELAAIFADFIKAKDAIAESGIKVAEKLFGYAQPVFDIIVKNDRNNPLWLSQMALINFIEIDSLKNFLTDPGNKKVRDKISTQIIMAYASAGGQIGAPQYDEEELKKILSGDFADYDDVVFAYTAGRAVSGSEKPEAVNLLVEILKGGEGIDRTAPIAWETAFLAAAMAHAGWQNYGVLSQENQEYLMKNAFYFSIAAGVPLRQIFEKYFSDAKTGEQSNINRIGQYVIDNEEQIPLDTNFTQARDLPEVVKNYLAQLQGKQTGGFELEEFIKGFYEGQPYREVYRSWLRDVLTLEIYLDSLSM